MNETLPGDPTNVPTLKERQKDLANLQMELADLDRKKEALGKQIKTANESIRAQERIHEIFGKKRGEFDIVYGNYTTPIARDSERKKAFDRLVQIHNEMLGLARQSPELQSVMTQVTTLFTTCETKQRAQTAPREQTLTPEQDPAMETAYLRLLYMMYDSRSKSLPARELVDILANLNDIITKSGNKDLKSKSNPMILRRVVQRRTKVLYNIPDQSPDTDDVAQLLKALEGAGSLPALDRAIRRHLETVRQEFFGLITSNTKLSVNEIGDLVQKQLASIPSPDGDSMAIKEDLAKLRQGTLPPQRDLEHSIPAREHPGACEDAVIYDPAQEVYGVLDGVSVSNRAAETARLCSEIFLHVYSEQMRSKVAPAVAMQHALTAAHQGLCAYAERIGKDGRYATTISAVALLPDHKAMLCHAGDSRVYIWRQGQLMQISIDDGYTKAVMESDQQVQGLETLQDKYDKLDPAGRHLMLTEIAAILDGVCKKGSNGELISSVAGKDVVLDSQMEFLYSNRNVAGKAITSLRKAGAERERTDALVIGSVYAFDTKPGDQILITSDGLHEALYPPEIAAVLRRSDWSAEQKAMALRYLARVSAGANEFRKGDDDISAVLTPQIS